MSSGETKNAKKMPRLSSKWLVKSKRLNADKVKFDNKENVKFKSKTTQKMG